MTASLKLRPAVGRRSLVDRLKFLVDEARRLPNRALGEAFRLQLETALAAAETGADETAILRAEAADREHARGALQSARADVAALTVSIEGMDPSLLSKAWLVERLQGVVSRVDESLKSKESTGV